MRTYDRPDPRVQKGLWVAERAGDERLVRSRLVWMKGIEDSIGKEHRADIQRSDSWLEWTDLSGAYLKHLKESAANGNLRATAPRAAKPRNRKVQSGINNRSIPNLRDGLGHFISRDKYEALHANDPA